jgi:predicted MFS family arabinose efflux permease
MRISERVLLLLLAAIQFTHIIDFMILMPMGPQLMRELSISAGRFSALVAAYSVCAGVVGLLASPFIDRFDRRTLMLIAYAGFAVSTAVCGFAPNSSFLLVGRGLAGAFGGVSGALCLTVVGDVIPPERRASAMGIVMTAFAAAAALGVPIGLQLAQWFGWRAPFLVVGTIAVCLWITLTRAIPPLRAHLAHAGNKRDSFLDLLRDGNAGRAMLFMVALVFGHFTVVPLLSPYLVGNVGFPENRLSLVYLVGGIASVLTAPRIGKLSDRYGRRKVFTIISVIACVVIFAVSHQGRYPVWLVLTLGGCFFTFASGRWVPAQAIMTLAVPASRRGAFMTLSSCARDLASGVSASLGGWIVTTDATGHVSHFGTLGWIAIGAAILSAVLAHWVRVNDTGLAPVVATTPVSEPATA